MTTIIIPARYQSTRFPGKPLVRLTGRGGVSKPLIQWTWETANAVRNVDAIYIATDDQRIADCAEGFGAMVVMTSSNCRNGTERCAEVVAHQESTSDLVVNLQGDAPLTPPWFVDDLVSAMTQDPSLQVATPVLRCDRTAYENLVRDRQAGRVGGTTAVFDEAGTALYFSKEVLPFVGSDLVEGAPIPVFHHVGVYGYRREALLAYRNWPEGKLERLEGLEQLRFLERGVAVKCVEVEARGRQFWELNNPTDVDRLEAVL